MNLLYLFLPSFNLFISSFLKVFLTTTVEALPIIFVSIINNAEMELFVDIFIFY